MNHRKVLVISVLQCECWNGWKTLRLLLMMPPPVSMTHSEGQNPPETLLLSSSKGGEESPVGFCIQAHFGQIQPKDEETIAT